MNFSSIASIFKFFVTILYMSRVPVETKDDNSKDFHLQYFIQYM